MIPYPHPSRSVLAEPTAPPTSEPPLPSDSGTTSPPAPTTPPPSAPESTSPTSSSTTPVSPSPSVEPSPTSIDPPSGTTWCGVPDGPPCAVAFEQGALDLLYLGLAFLMALVAGVLVAQLRRP